LGKKKSLNGTYLNHLIIIKIFLHVLHWNNERGRVSLSVHSFYQGISLSQISEFYASYKLAFSVFLLTLTGNSINILLFKKLYVVAERERRLTVEKDGCHINLFVVDSNYNLRIPFPHTTISILSKYVY
jgi:hypothetical protein